MMRLQIQTVKKQQTNKQKTLDTQTGFVTGGFVAFWINYNGAVLDQPAKQKHFLLLEEYISDYTLQWDHIKTLLLLHDVLRQINTLDLLMLVSEHAPDQHKEGLSVPLRHYNFLTSKFLRSL